MRMTDDESLDLDPDVPLDPSLLDAARAYHAPPSPPRDAMWADIQAVRSGHARRRSVPVPPWIGLALAASLILATGIALGRWTNRAPTPPLAFTPTARPERNGLAYQVAVVQNLAATEALLTAFRSNTGSDSAMSAWARDLLSNTRLLLDSPAGVDPGRRRLLEDLELVLVQIVQLGPANAADREMIDRALEHDHVLTRLRTAVPAGQAGT
jgi:hypothetical protein